MKQIQLTKGMVALVDDADFDWLNKWNWNVSNSGNKYYAVRRHGIKEGGRGEIITMHRSASWTIDRHHLRKAVYGIGKVYTL